MKRIGIIQNIAMKHQNYRRMRCSHTVTQDISKIKSTILQLLCDSIDAPIKVYHIEFPN